MNSHRRNLLLYRLSTETSWWPAVTKMVHICLLLIFNSNDSVDFLTVFSYLHCSHSFFFFFLIWGNRGRGSSIYLCHCLSCIRCSLFVASEFSFLFVIADKELKGWRFGDLGLLNMTEHVISTLCRFWPTLSLKRHAGNYFCPIESEESVSWPSNTWWNLCEVLLDHSLML